MITLQTTAEKLSVDIIKLRLLIRFKERTNDFDGLDQCKQTLQQLKDQRDNFSKKSPYPLTTMPRTKKVNPVTDTPIAIESEPSTEALPQESEQSSKSNILTLAPNVEPTQNRDTSQIDGWLQELGITFS